MLLLLCVAWGAGAASLHWPPGPAVATLPLWGLSPELSGSASGCCWLHEDRPSMLEGQIPTLPLGASCLWYALAAVSLRMAASLQPWCYGF